MKHHTGLATLVDLQHTNANIKREFDKMVFFAKKGKQNNLRKKKSEGNAILLIFSS
jgi:hypothetical protein